MDGASVANPSENNDTSEVKTMKLRIQVCRKNG